MDITRRKTDFEHHSWLNDECCAEICKFIEWRNTPPDCEKYCQRECKQDNIDNCKNNCDEYKSYLKWKIYSNDDFLFCKQLQGNDFLDCVSETDGYIKEYEVKNKDDSVKEIISIDKLDEYFRKLSDNTSTKIYRRIARKSDLKNIKSTNEEKYFDLFRSHNLRRFMSTTLNTHAKFEYKEHWMGHSLGVSSDYDKIDDDESKIEYLKVMWRLYISSDYQRDGYIQQFHKSEIEKAEMQKNHAVSFYEHDIENLELGIQDYEHKINDLEILLNNGTIKDEMRLYFNMMLNDYKTSIENFNKSIKSKQALLEIEIKDYDKYLDEINKKYETSLQAS